MKKSDAAKRQGLESMSKRRPGEKSSKRLGEISPRDSKNEAAATTIKIVIATAPFYDAYPFYQSSSPKLLMISGPKPLPFK